MYKTLTTAVIMTIVACYPVRAETVALPIEIIMQWGKDNSGKMRVNHPERVHHYMGGTVSKTIEECEKWLMEDKLGSGTSSVMEQVGYHKRRVWNNYASDNTTIVQQWRCVSFVFDVKKIK